jgi:hypothetical protein
MEWNDQITSHLLAVLGRQLGVEYTAGKLDTPWMQADGYKTYLQLASPVRRIVALEALSEAAAELRTPVPPHKFSTFRGVRL